MSVIETTRADAFFFAGAELFGHCIFHAVVDLRRTLSVREVSEAVAATLDDYPVLGCRYERRLWRDVWVPLKDAPSLVLNFEEGKGEVEALTQGWVRRKIDPEREPPFRVAVIPRPAGARLVFSVLHIAVDGGGAMALAQAFGAHLYGVETTAPISKERGMAPMLGGIGAVRFPQLLAGLAWHNLGGAALFRARAHRPYETTENAPRSWGQLCINEDDFEAFKRRCKAAGATVNDGLIAAQACIAAKRRAGGPVDVSYTIDLRRYLNSPRLIATNFSSVCSLVLEERDAQDFDRALAAVARRTRLHRKILLGPAAALSIVAPAGLPHGLFRLVGPAVFRLVVSAMIRRATVLTNIGRLDGGLEVFAGDIEDIQIIGPILDDFPLPFLTAIGFGSGLRLQVTTPPGLSPLEVERQLDALRELLT